MSLAITPPSIAAQSIRLAKCWRITQTVGTVLQFTDHNSDLLVLVEGTYITFSPVDGFHVTTRDSTEGGSSYEAEGPVKGVFSLNDFLARRFDNAVVEEFLVDWKHPWAGTYRLNKYWMGAPTSDGIRFKVPLESVFRYMSVVHSKRIGKVCIYDLFDPATCKASTVNKVFPGVTSVTTGETVQRLVIVTTTGGPIPDGLADSVFDDAELVWTSGANTGITTNVKTSEDRGGLGSHWLLFYFPTPEDIDDSDTFTLSYGCDRLIKTCNNKFSNVENFGAEPDIPGAAVAANVERVKKKKK